MTDDTWAWVSAFIVLMLGMAWVVGLFARRAERRHADETATLPPDLPIVVGSTDRTEELRTCVAPLCYRGVYVPIGTPKDALVVCAKHGSRSVVVAVDPIAVRPAEPTIAAPSPAPPPAAEPEAEPELEAPHRGWWAQRRARKAQDAALGRLMDESTATRERGRSYVLMKAEEHDVQVRFKAWDDAESARIARELVSDLRVIYPDASEPELAAFIKSLRSRASAPPTSVRKVP